jgi:phosphopantetheine adenylyltransferase
MSEHNPAAAEQPAEIRAFLEAIGPRRLTPEEARQLNLLRLKHGLPAMSVTGVAALLADDEKE